MWIGRFVFPHKTLFILFMQIQSTDEVIHILFSPAVDLLDSAFSSIANPRARAAD
jgi:hypothetical protein